MTQSTRTRCVESFHLKKSNNYPSEAEVTYKTKTLFDLLDDLDMHEYDSPGVGMEYRFQSDTLTGIELDYKNHLIHLTALNNSGDFEYYDN